MAAAPKCSVTMSTSPATAGLVVEALLEGEDAFLGGLSAAKDAVVDRRTTGTTSAGGTVTLDIYRAAYLNNDPATAASRKYRWRVPALDMDVRILVPDAATAILEDLIVSN